MDAIEYLIYTLLFLVLIAFIGVIGYIIYDNYTYKNNLTSDLNTNFIDINQNFNSTSNVIGTLHEKHSSNIGILGNRITDTNTVFSSNIIDINNRYTASSNLFNNTVTDFNTRYKASSNLFNNTVVNFDTRYTASSNLYRDNADNFNHNLNKYFTFTNAENTDGNKKIFEYRTAAVDSTTRLNLITKTTATAGLKLNTDTNKEFELCNSMGEKCFNMRSADDSLSIYKPTTQGGSGKIYIGGNDETAPLKIVGNKVFINGAEYVPTPATSVPKVHATATAALIISPTITIGNDGGSGYTSALTVSIAAPPVGGIQAEATPTLGTGANAGKIVSITVTKFGAGYISVPVITLNRNGGTGIDATATAALIISPTITIGNNGGSGYTSAPTVTIDSPPTGGSLATATAALGATGSANADKVVSITLTAPGSGYTSVPKITITGGGIV